MLKNKKQAVERKTREIALPQEVIELAEMTHASMPYQARANINEVFFGFMFLLFFSILIGFYIDSINAADAVDFSHWLVGLCLFLILPSIGYWGFNYVKKSANNLLPSAYVTPTELYIEDQQTNPITKDTLMTWASVTSTPYKHADIFFTTSYEGNFKYWNFADQNGLRKVGLSLSNKKLVGPSMKNKWEINRAILANFAVHAKEPLAIDSAVLVSLEINPITWQRDKQPKYTEGLFLGIATLALCVALFIFLYSIDRDAGMGYIIGGMVLALIVILLPIALFGYQLSAKLFPEFYGDSIVFVPPKLKTAFEQAIDDFYSAK